jgi:hypothetical protein
LIPAPGLADWVDLRAQIRRDTGRPAATLGPRDRAIGKRLTHLAGRPSLALTAWVREVRELGSAAPDAPDTSDTPDTSVRSRGLACADAVRLAILLLSLFSLVAGAGAAVGAFSFQPYGRINVVTVLGLLVGLPNLFFLFALFGALPDGLRRRVPWPSSATAREAPLRPARLVLRVLPQEVRETLEQALGTSGALAKLTAPLRRWLLLRASQTAAVAFASGALTAALVQVVFTDLSFGWSTTLEVDVGRVHDIVRVVAAPWAWLWPDASPSLGLLESTRFFRIAPEPGSAVALYGRWWPFVLMCMFVYGWLPRALFLLFARTRLRAALRNAIAQAPGSRRVLARLESPLVESASPVGATESRSRTDEAPALRESPLPERAIAISWGNALALPEAAPIATAAVVRCQTGAPQTPAEDLATLEQAASKAREHDVAIVFAVRGYEPPLAEQIDLIAALRRAAGDGRAIVVAAIRGDEAQLGAWRRRLATLADPWLVLAALPTFENVEPE